MSNFNSVSAVSEINIMAKVLDCVKDNTEALILKQANKHAFAIRKLHNAATEEQKKANANMAKLTTLISTMAEQKFHK